MGFKYKGYVMLRKLVLEFFESFFRVFLIVSLVFIE